MKGWRHMPKRKDPAVHVLRYFETAELAQAQLLFALVKETVTRRTPVRVPTEGTRPRRPRIRRAIAAADPGTS